MLSGQLDKDIDQIIQLSVDKRQGIPDQECPGGIIIIRTGDPQPDILSGVFAANFRQSAEFTGNVQLLHNCKFRHPFRFHLTAGGFF